MMVSVPDSAFNRRVPLAAGVGARADPAVPAAAERKFFIIKKARFLAGFFYNFFPSLESMFPAAIEEIRKAS